VCLSSAINIVEIGLKTVMKRLFRDTAEDFGGLGRKVMGETDDDVSSDQFY